MRIGPVVVAVVLVLAGCNAPGGSGAPESPTSTSPTEPPTTASPTARPTTAANPWGEETVTVSVVNTVSPWRNLSRHVAASLSYWERHDEEYGTYQVSFELRQNASNPDVIVRYVESISECGAVQADLGAGYASRISPSNPPERPEIVCIRAGYTDRGTRRIVDHEFGHLLGIRHGEEPLPLMNTDFGYLRIPRPGREVLAFSPPRDPLRVYTSYEGIYGGREYRARRQIEHVLAYYERGADGTVEDPVTFVRTDNRSEADLVVTFPTEAPCGKDTWGTCGQIVERADGADQLSLALRIPHEDMIAWHVGFWLGYALDVDRHTELAPPFRNATFEERLSRWWEPTENASAPSGDRSG